jgi:hypothetical protein
LTGSCGYSGKSVIPEHYCIFWANQGLFFTMFSVVFLMITCFTRNLVTTSLVMHLLLGFTRVKLLALNHFI